MKPRNVIGMRTAATIIRTPTTFPGRFNVSTAPTLALVTTASASPMKTRRKSNSARYCHRLAESARARAPTTAASQAIATTTIRADVGRAEALIGSVPSRSQRLAPVGSTLWTTASTTALLTTGRSIWSRSRDARPATVRSAS